MKTLDLFDICQSNHGGNENSTEAHESIVSSKQKLQSQILAAIQAVGSLGRTCEEIEALLGLSHQTASARVSELKRDGKIQIIGKRPTKSGRSAAVYRAFQARAFRWA